MFKYVLLANLLALANARSIGESGHEEHFDHNPKYKFHYHVEDHHTGDIKSQEEFRNGDHVTGIYSLVEPDGSKRTVEYSADKHSGFHAIVSREHSNHKQIHHESNLRESLSSQHLSSHNEGLNQHLLSNHHETLNHHGALNHQETLTQNVASNYQQVDHNEIFQHHQPIVQQAQIHQEAPKLHTTHGLGHFASRAEQFHGNEKLSSHQLGQQEFSSHLQHGNSELHKFGQSYENQNLGHSEVNFERLHSSHGQHGGEAHKAEIKIEHVQPLKHLDHHGHQNIHHGHSEIKFEQHHQPIHHHEIVQHHEIEQHNEHKLKQHELEQHHEIQYQHQPIHHEIKFESHAPLKIESQQHGHSHSEINFEQHHSSHGHGHHGGVTHNSAIKIEHIQPVKHEEQHYQLQHEHQPIHHQVKFENYAPLKIESHQHGHSHSEINFEQNHSSHGHGHHGGVTHNSAIKIEHIQPVKHEEQHYQLQYEHQPIHHEVKFENHAPLKIESQQHGQSHSEINFEQHHSSHGHTHDGGVTHNSAIKIEHIQPVKHEEHYDGQLHHGHAEINVQHKYQPIQHHEIKKFEHHVPIHHHQEIENHQIEQHHQPIQHEIKIEHHESPKIESHQLEQHGHGHSEIDIEQLHSWHGYGHGHVESELQKSQIKIEHIQPIKHHEERHHGSHEVGHSEIKFELHNEPKLEHHETQRHQAINIGIQDHGVENHHQAIQQHHFQDDLSEGYKYDKPSIKFEGYKYDKPAIKFELPSHHK